MSENTETTVDLVAVAKDLNTGLGLDPEIDTTLPEEELLAAIKQESTQVGQNIKTNKVDLAVAAADEQALSPETWSFLQEQGFLKHIEDARAAKAPKAKPAKAGKPAGEGKPAKAGKPAGEGKPAKAGKPAGEGTAKFGALKTYRVIPGADFSGRKGGYRDTLDAFAEGATTSREAYEMVLKKRPTYKFSDVGADIFLGRKHGYLEVLENAK